MSTKITLLYGWPKFDGEENDYHLYYDIADGIVHLRIKDREIELPPKLSKELREIFSIYKSVVDLVASLIAHAEYRGDLDFYRKIIGRIGETSFNRIPYDKIYGENIEDKKDEKPGVILIHKGPKEGSINIDVFVREEIEKQYAQLKEDLYDVIEECPIAKRFLRENEGYVYLGSEDLSHSYDVNVNVLHLLAYLIQEGFELRSVEEEVTKE